MQASHRFLSYWSVFRMTSIGTLFIFTTFVVGYEIDCDDLVALSRLRNKNLKRLDVPGFCLTTTDNYNQTHIGVVDDRVIGEVSDRT